MKEGWEIKRHEEEKLLPERHTKWRHVFAEISRKKGWNGFSVTDSSGWQGGSSQAQ